MIRGILLIILLAALCVWIMARDVLAAPPEGADPALAPFFRSLLRPDTGTSCCDISDCSPVESLTAGDHYQALAGDEWIDIPNDKIIRPQSNPAGRAILCMAPGAARLIYCFAPGIET